MCCNLFKEMLDSFPCVWSWEVCFHPGRVAALHSAHTHVSLLDREMQTRTLGPKSAHVFRASMAIGWGKKQVLSSALGGSDSVEGVLPALVFSAL